MSESSMLVVLKFAIAFDERLDSESRSPDGDDYNVVMNLVRAAIAEASAPVASVAVARPRVVVDVSGGVAEVTECPDGVDVDIVDHDNLEAEKEDELAALMGRGAS